MIYEIFPAHGWILLLFLWVLFFWLYRDYRLDLFRQRMFSLRDDLFDLADSGAISFDHKAYGMLRSVINGNIQFGHQLGFLELLVAALVSRRNAHQKTHFEKSWEHACQSLPTETADKMRSIRTRMHVLIFDQLVFTSFLLMVTMVALVVAILTFFAKRLLTRLVEKLLRQIKVIRLITNLEYAASTGGFKAK